MTDSEKMLAWLEYAINVNYDEYHDSGDSYWGGRMSAYRNVKQRLKDNDFEIPEEDNDDDGREVFGVGCRNWWNSGT